MILLIKPKKWYFNRFNIFQEKICVFWKDVPLIHISCPFDGSGPCPVKLCKEQVGVARNLPGSRGKHLVCIQHKIYSSLWSVHMENLYCHCNTKNTNTSHTNTQHTLTQYLLLLLKVYPWRISSATTINPVSCWISHHLTPNVEDLILVDLAFFH